MFTIVQTSCLVNVPKKSNDQAAKFSFLLRIRPLVPFFFTLQLCSQLSYPALSPQLTFHLAKITCSSLTCYYLSTTNLIREPKITLHRLSYLFPLASSRSLMKIFLLRFVHPPHIRRRHSHLHINSVPSLLIILSRLLPWTTQHTQQEIDFPMHFHAVLMETT